MATVKTYQITVNGKTYEVDVMEKGSQPISTPAAAPVAAKPAPAPVAAAPAPAAAAPKAPSASGGSQVSAPMPGKIISVKVSVGEPVKKDQELLVMEAMKMHNPILASCDGTVKEILVKPTDSVQTGTVLVVIG